MAGGGVQACPGKDASAEPLIDTATEDKVFESVAEPRSIKTEWRKDKGKEEVKCRRRKRRKHGTRTETDTPPSPKAQGDTVMEDRDRYSPYEDPSEYEELEDGALVNPPPSPTTKRQVGSATVGNPNPPNSSQPPRLSTKTNT